MCDTNGTMSGLAEPNLILTFMRDQDAGNTTTPPPSSRPAFHPAIWELKSLQRPPFGTRNNDRNIFRRDKKGGVADSGFPWRITFRPLHISYFQPNWKDGHIKRRSLGATNLEVEAFAHTNFSQGPPCHGLYQTSIFQQQMKGHKTLSVQDSQSYLTSRSWLWSECLSLRLKSPCTEFWSRLY
ncbi:uncharacterized protein EV420DRAFT_343077 [Desarmillaria tabescens]|uniref:Uncharacterized protein n=1 Tax=Armillaria tabescens TaxID=1929756 RepID=A0AA39KFK7_ARMTA|nr:uncharacterized protein EV420DRAFT_343077 [Desarmillaria tabescens]KAK0458966.1 hypothetical protein EV420DRAFT_343077 [Desarmillaria tabescens]